MIDVNRKRLISMKFILKQVFEMLNISHKLPVTKSEKTLTSYEHYWEKIQELT